MKKLHLKEPKLVFFRDKPENLRDLPPLASSLQHLETSFLLIALKRYPHALVSCASAIESAIKSSLGKGPKEKNDFKQLMDSAFREFANFTNLSEVAIKDFRDKRNEIAHYGFSPKDDEISAYHLLNAGFPLIEQCYEAFFQFSLIGNEKYHGGLLPEIAHHLLVAKNVFSKKRDKAHSAYCFSSFSHLIRFNIQRWMLSDWQKDILFSEIESGWKSWEIKHKQKEDLTSKFGASWVFDCPVCNDVESFVCDLDVENLKKREGIIKRGICVNCGFVVSNDDHFLADELFKEQINQQETSILSEYGLL